jgi:hypothetical protein
VRGKELGIRSEEFFRGELGFCRLTAFIFHNAFSGVPPADNKTVRSAFFYPGFWRETPKTGRIFLNLLPLRCFTGSG